jgi:hypothetical protein
LLLHSSPVSLLLVSLVCLPLEKLAVSPCCGCSFNPHASLPCAQKTVFRNTLTLDSSDAKIEQTRTLRSTCSVAFALRASNLARAPSRVLQCAACCCFGLKFCRRCVNWRSLIVGSFHRALLQPPPRSYLPVQCIQVRTSQRSDAAAGLAQSVPLLMVTGRSAVGAPSSCRVKRTAATCRRCGRRMTPAASAVIPCLQASNASSRSCHRCLQLLTPTPSLSLMLHLSLSPSHSLCPDECRSFPNASSAAAPPLLAESAR